MLVAPQGGGGDGDPATHGRSFGSREAVGALRSRQALERSGEGYLGRMGPPLAPPKNPGTLLPFLPEDRGGRRCRRCPVGAGRAGFRVPSAGTPPSAPPHPKTLTLAPDFPVAPRGPRWPRGPCGKRQRWLGDPRPIDLGAGTPKPAGEDPPPPRYPYPRLTVGPRSPLGPDFPERPYKRERASGTCHGAGPHSIVPPPWGHSPTAGGGHSPERPSRHCCPENRGTPASPGEGEFGDWGGGQQYLGRGNGDVKMGQPHGRRHRCAHLGALAPRVPGQPRHSQFAL